MTFVHPNAAHTDMANQVETPNRLPLAHVRQRTSGQSKVFDVTEVERGHCRSSMCLPSFDADGIDAPLLSRFGDVRPCVHVVIQSM